MGTKLYSGKGIDFRVNQDESIIGIIINQELNLLDNNGKLIKSFQRDKIITDPQEHSMFGFLDWGPGSIWLNIGAAGYSTGLTKIDSQTFLVTKYDLKDLSTGDERSLSVNVHLEKLAFSDYPVMFDAASVDEYEKSGTKVNLRVYDLKTKNQQTIATSTTKRFEPEWIDDDTLEYNDPNSENRTRRRLLSK